MATTNSTTGSGGRGDAGSPWPQLLDGQQLLRRDLNMAKLAERVGVSAAYLRLVRQGKRSPSSETATKLLEALGYETRQEDAGDGQPDIVAVGDDGRVVRVEAKSRSPKPPLDGSLIRFLREALARMDEFVAVDDDGHVVRVETKASPSSPSVERQLDELRAYSRDLKAKLEAASQKLEELVTRLREVEGSKVKWPSSAATPGGELNPALTNWGFASYLLTHRPAPGLHLQGPRRPVISRRMWTTSRRRGDVEELLSSVPDEDLPLVAAYLTALIERQQATAESGAARHPLPAATTREEGDH